MSSENFVIEAEVRTDLGKSASRRLRRTDKIPAILYGAGEDPMSLSVDHKSLLHKLENEGFYSHILTVKVGGKEENAILKDLQRHPSKPIVMHMDLLRVNMSEKIRVHIPLHFINEEQSPGVKEGGLITHSITETEISCMPKELPEYLEVDLSNLELDGVVHLSDIKLPAAIEIVELTHGSGHDQPVASVHMPRAAKEGADDDAESSEGGDEAAASSSDSEEGKKD